MISVSRQVPSQAPIDWGLVVSRSSRWWRDSRSSCTRARKDSTIIQIAPSNAVAATPISK